MLPCLYFKKDSDFYPSCALNISTKIFLPWAKCLYHCSPDICSAPYLELLKGCIYLGTEQSYKSAWKVLWDVLKTPVIKTASGVFFHQSFWISDFKLFSQSEEIKMLWCWKLNPRLACYHLAPEPFRRAEYEKTLDESLQYWQRTCSPLNAGLAFDNWESEMSQASLCKKEIISFSE